MRTIVPLAVAAMSVACYTPRAVDSAPDVYAAAPYYGAAPLEASLFYDEYSGYASFDLSRPAHVAVFAMRPGGGLEIIYPVIGLGLGNRTGFSAGRHSIRTAGGPFRMAGSWSMAYGMEPMYILLIASDEPMDTRSFQATRTMGWLNRASVTYSPYLAIEALVGEIVPRPMTSAWTSAIHVVWPSPSERPLHRYVLVRCQNGMTVRVPMEAVLWGYPVCPEELREQPADSAKSKTLIGVVNPRPGAPPAGWMSTTIGDADLRSELERIREQNGKRTWGELTVRPFPAEPVERTRPGSQPTEWATRTRDDERARSRPTTRSSTRPEARPSRPAPTPSARPASPPSRPAPAQPSRPDKPKPGGGSGS